MSGDSSARPLLPQTAQMQSFSFAPPAGPPRENQRNYVFVDEHNRHKRLKVMRACEGCRRRKIKCDAATTNSWPCAACIRLKLNCVPPTVSYEKDFGTGSQTFELERPQEYIPQSAGVSPVEEYQRQNSLHNLSSDVNQALSQSAPIHYAETPRMYPPAQYVDTAHQELQQYSNMQAPPLLTADINPNQQAVYPTQPPPQAIATPESEGSWRNESASTLAEALGELKIDHTAIAPYITNQRKALQSAPAVEEFELQLPQPTSPDATVRIPLELMPSEAQALQMFDYFFTNIHPYVPVIDRSYFYQQWQTERDSISPLILEAIFACSTLMLGEQSQGNKWLALAAKHEESFKDVPRLSTIQAMLLIMKARESVPKRGYFYRSWVMVESCVSMAKELELNNHLELHEGGGSCGSTPADCLTKTLIWQALYVVELMVGAPQGRNDFGIDPETVCFDMNQNLTGVDEQEIQTARQFTYFTRIINEVRVTSQMHFRLRKLRKDWPNHPDFVNHNQQYSVWLRDLPQDLQIAFPPDGSHPWIPSHFVANLHCYYNLAIVMHHRPQLHSSNDLFDGSWKQHFLICYSAAKKLCRLQEAILHNFGMAGLLCMQRGISFTIYAVLTCTMLHLVAITSPDPDINADARDFFVRHMRILEDCAPAWPMPEMQEQISALRTAFSADTAKPFELKPSFPLGSPMSQSNPSPLSGGDHYRTRDPVRTASMEHPGQVIYSTHPLTPPISAHDNDPKTDSPIAQSLVMMASGQRQQPALPTPVHQVQHEPVQWNPSKIFDSWNVAFGTPPTTTAQSSPPLRPPTGSFEVRTPQETHPPGFQPLPNISPQGHQLPNMQAQLPPPVSYAPPAAAYVSPSMWQDAVASSFGDGRLKRGWEYQTMDPMAKRQR